MKKCPNCNTIFKNKVKVCPDCGEELIHVYKKSKKRKMTFGDYFFGMFKKHTKEQKEQIFACGTKNSTPDIMDVDTNHVRPWVFGGVFVMMLIASAILFICVKVFDNTNAFPGFMILSSFLIPVTCLFFFFEMNVTRNISFPKVIKFLLVGGCASLLVTLLLYQVVNVNELTVVTAILVGLVEELGKMVVTVFIIYATKSKYKVNGLLIGSIVGAGFAAFESAGYAFNLYMDSGFDSMMFTVVARAILAPGGHVIWAAMVGYGMDAAIEKHGFTIKSLLNFRVWLLFLLAVGLHGLWDMPLGLDVVKAAALTIIGWIILLQWLLPSSLKQIDKIKEEERKKRLALEEERVRIELTEEKLIDFEV